MAYFDRFPTTSYELQKTRRIIKNILRKVVINDALKDNVSVFIEYHVKDGERPESIANKLYGSPNLHWIIMLMNDMVNPFYDWLLPDRSLYATYQKTYGTIESGSLGLVSHYVDKNGHIIPTNINLRDELLGEEVDALTLTLADDSIDFEAQDTVTIITDGDDFEETVFNWDDETLLLVISEKNDYSGLTIQQVQKGTETVNVTLTATTNAIEPFPVYIQDVVFDENESERTIKLLKPNYVPQVVDEFKKLMK